MNKKRLYFDMDGVLFDTENLGQELMPKAARAFGREMNIRLGPALMPSTPMKVYTAGTIIMPARKATTVSKISIWLTDLTILVSFLT